MAFEEVGYIFCCEFLEFTAQQRSITILLGESFQPLVIRFEEIREKLERRVFLGISTLFSMFVDGGLPTGIRVGPDLLKHGLSVVGEKNAGSVV
jgi:hypothetical protein